MYGSEGRPIRKATAREWLADVCMESAFHCRDGREFKNLQELSAGLRTMTDETYKYHVTPDKNDFSNWIRDIVGDEALAELLRAVEGRAAAAARVEGRLAELRTRAWLRGQL